MQKQWLFFAPFLLVILLISTLACAANKQAVESVPAAPPVVSPYMAPASKDMAGERDSSSGSGGTANSIDRKIVRTGSFTLEVKDIGKTQDDISALAAQLGGFVVSSNQRANEADPTGYISIRIPSDRFDEASRQIRAMGLKVIYETTNSQDVTEQYTDLKAQLKNLEATETQYLELMKKAENVKDILEVQRELSNVRGEIERVKGRIQYLDRTSDMSLIEVSLRKSRPIGESKWDITSILRSAVDGLITFGQVLLSIVIWLLVFSPVWILIIVIIWLVRRRSKARVMPKA